MSNSLQINKNICFCLNNVQVQFSKPNQLLEKLFFGDAPKT